MNDLRLIDIAICLVVGDKVVMTREELVDIWNKQNPDNPADYELKLSAELKQNE